MKKLTVTEVARNFSAVMDGVESDGEEIVLIRNQRAVARLAHLPQFDTGSGKIHEGVGRICQQSRGGVCAEAL